MTRGSGSLRLTAANKVYELTGVGVTRAAPAAFCVTPATDVKQVDAVNELQSVVQFNSHGGVAALYHGIVHVERVTLP